MADVFVEENTLRGIANAIRSKNGSSATYFPAEMEQAILDLQIPDVSALDATAADILYPKKAFTADGETEGTIQTKSASDVTVSGDTVSAPAGYYPNAVSKSVQSGSAATPATIISANPTISVNNSTGLVTASVNKTQAITPTVSEGYVSAGTPGNVRASGSATSQLPTQGAATITPTRSQQTAVAAGKFTTGDVIVDPIPSEYIVPTGTKQISITANGTTTEDVAAYANAEITVNVSGGGGSDYLNPLEPTGVYYSDYNGEVPRYALAYRTQVTEVNAPNVTGLTYNSFANCYAKHIYVPNALNSRNANAIFMGCPNLESLALPSATNALWANSIRDCPKLEAVDLAVSGLSGAQGFYNDALLTVLVLRHTAVVTLANVNWFQSTPFASGGAGGTIYIPKALYDVLGTGTSSDYKAATNWSTLDGYGTITWAKIEGSYYETHYADGTTIPT